MDYCILKIVSAKTKHTLYEYESYEAGEFERRDSAPEVTVKDTHPVNHTNEAGQLKAYRFDGEAIVPTLEKIGKIEFIDLDGLYEVLNPLSE